MTILRPVFSMAVLAALAPMTATAQTRKPDNQDESKVVAHPLPDPLTMADGSLVTTPEAWRAKRRPELVALFEREMFGKTPIGRLDGQKFVVLDEKSDALGGKATRLRIRVLFTGKEADPSLELLVYLPNKAKGPVPVFLGLNFQGNHAVTNETDIPLPKHWVRGTRGGTNVATDAGRGAEASRWRIEYALDHGYGVATACYCEVEPDENNRWSDGVRKLAPPKGESDWGAIAAWAWSLGRALDYLETNPRVDSKRVAVIGHSRLGKTSLWAGAVDERFAMVVSNDSGAGGAALSRRDFGETIEHLTTSFPHWFCPKYKTHANNEAAAPFDQHELIALIAPRPVLIHSATEDLWADPKGEFLSGVGADPVYRLLGTDGIATKEWPKPGTPVHSTIGYLLRPGKHDVTLEDWTSYVAFADKHLKAARP